MRPALLGRLRGVDLKMARYHTSLRVLAFTAACHLVKTSQFFISLRKQVTTCRCSIKRTVEAQVKKQYIVNPALTNYLQLWSSDLCSLRQFVCCLWFTQPIIALVTADEAQNSRQDGKYCKTQDFHVPFISRILRPEQICQHNGWQIFER